MATRKTVSQSKRLEPRPATPAGESRSGPSGDDRFLRQFAAILRLSTLLTSAKDKEQMLEMGLDAALQALGWEAGMVHLLDEATGLPCLRAWRGLSPEALAHARTLAITGEITGLFAPAGRPLAVWETKGIRALATAPIRLGDTAVGRLTVASFHARELQPTDVAFLEALAAQMGAAIAYLELRQSSRQSLMKLDALQQVSNQISSNLDIEPVLQSVLGTVETVLGITRCAVYDVPESGGRLRCIASRGVPQELIRTTEDSSRRSPAHKIVSTGIPMPLRNLDEYPGDPRVAETAVRLGLNSAMFVPLVMGGQRHGVLSLYDTKPRDWSPSDIRMGQMLARAVAVALTNLRLYEKVVQAAARLQRLHEVSMRLIESEDLARTAIAATESGLELLQADVVSIHVYDPEYRLLKLLAVYPPHAECAPSVVAVGHGVQGKAIREGKPVARALSLARCEFDGFAVALPLKSHDELLGVLSAYRVTARGAFANQEIEFIHLFASMVAATLQNAKLLARSEELGVISERNRIVSEVHDAVGNELASLLMKAELAKHTLGEDVARTGAELGFIASGLQRAIAELRRILFALRPLELEQKGLLEALRKLASDFTQQNGAQVSLHLSDSIPRLSTRMDYTLYRVAQECLNNIRKYAGASSVVITLGVTDGSLVLTVEDDGRGFDAQGVAKTRGIGLRNLRERVDSAGGALQITSAPGQGTRITAMFPLIAV